VPDLICESCGTRFWQYRGRPAKRCGPCRGEDRYGPTHRATRAATVNEAIGHLCARCQRVMLPGQAVELDHDDQDPTKYVGYSHSSCNRSAGASRGNAMRAAAYRQAKGLPAPNGISLPRAKEKSPGTPVPGELRERPDGGFERWSTEHGWTPVSRRW
jgi:hypothetical protein